ncbi:hypothetical protein [Streptomyces sp. MUM 2J]|uniref:hypothetical protein n=1 Tax=unclassified Streptomyces TaxID=2593676 RepID=UPI0035AB9D8D|nr:hypothetical protein [Streptomyces sp. MUM 2J]MCH0570125.1 hypothetical protein [Streptomyces sp. MUM 136J]
MLHPGPAPAALPCRALFPEAGTLTDALPLLAAALLVAGSATAPTVITTMTPVQQRTPEGRLSEGTTLAVTKILAGTAAGSAIGGWTAEHVSPVAGYGVPVAAARPSLLVALVRRQTAR